MHKLDTLFLDRDGVINVKLDRRYVQNFSDFEFMSGAEHAIAHLTKIFKRILVITNQQGIGKGIMTIQDLTLLSPYLHSYRYRLRLGYTIVCKDQSLVTKQIS